MLAAFMFKIFIFPPIEKRNILKHKRKIITLSAVIYGCETSSITLKGLTWMRIFTPKGQLETGQMS
jgi:hypothetical protein